MATDQPSGANKTAARVQFVNGAGDLPLLRAESARSTAEIYLHGAHVTHFQKHGEPPLLFLSAASRFAAGQPIRGGVPVILPWFGAREGAAAHGFARNRPWQLQEIRADRDGAIAVQLQLQAEPTPGFAAFIADYTVTVGETLGLELSITNHSADTELAFEECLHTYFSVGAIDAVSITGLKGASYLDKVAGFAQKTETNDAIQIASEVDRVYLDTAAAVEIRDSRLRRNILVEKEGSNSTVVWNPWIAKARQMPDFGDDEYLRMVCVESGNVGANRVTLTPGKSATIKVRISSGQMV